MSESSNDAGAQRRRSHVGMPLVYASVGASQAPDLLRYPPAGSTPYEEVLRLGSGEERFVTASSLLMTWAAPRGAGIGVEDIEAGHEDGYEGVVFDAAGGAQTAAPREDTFGPDGSPYLTAGTTATIVSPEQGSRRVLVVYTVSEPRRVGFAWGSGDELGAVGEQLFLVEHRDDDTVWAVARGFLTSPKSGLFGLKARSYLRGAIEDAKRQIQALAPGATVPTAAERAESEGAAVPVDAEMQVDVEDPTSSEQLPEVEDAVEVQDPADAVDTEGASEAEDGAEVAAEESSRPVPPRRPGRAGGAQGE